MRFLISGLGSIGRRHMWNLIALGQTDVVLHRTGKSTMPDDELDGFLVEHDLSLALERWRPEAVIVSNPTAYHLDVAIPAAEAGCTILLEKPISHSMDRVGELRRAMKAGGGQILVGFHFRFHPGLQHIKDLILNDAIGRPIGTHAHWGEYLPGWHPWEDYRAAYSARKDLGGGVLLTLCHPFDYLRWLLGDVTSVSAITGTLGGLGIEVEDTAEVLISFDDGLAGSVHLDYNQRPSSHWMEITGTRGRIHWDNDSGTVRTWTLEKQTWETFSPPSDFERNTMYVDEMRHFIELVQGETESMCDLDDGVEALKIVLAAKASALQSVKVDLAAVE